MTGPAISIPLPQCYHTCVPVQVSADEEPKYLHVLQGASGSYAILQTLVSEKAHITILLGAPVHSHEPGVHLLGKAVVIKVTHKGPEEPSGSTQLLLTQARVEIDSLRELSIPGSEHVIALLDSMEDEDGVYMVLPYLPGSDLCDRMRARGCRGLSERSVGFVMSAVTQGLLYMKARGFAHGDVSLENVMMDERGVCKLVDFGMCARLTQPPSPSSASMLLLGKPSYVSPEVAALRRMGLGSPNPQGLYSHLICGGDQMDVVGAPGGGHCEGGGCAVEVQKQTEGCVPLPPVTRPFSKEDAEAAHNHRRAVGGAAQLWALGEGGPPVVPSGGGGEGGRQRGGGMPDVDQNQCSQRAVDPCARDMWALGVFMFILLLGCPIYADPGDPAFALLCASPSAEGSATEGVDFLIDRYCRLDRREQPSASAIDLLRGLLTVDPEKRLTIEQVSRHPWMLAHAEHIDMLQTPPLAPLAPVAPPHQPLQRTGGRVVT